MPLEGTDTVQGTLDDFDLRYVFKFLSGARKTGKLSVTGPSATGRVFFRDGDVYHAESDVRREGFGRRLVNAKKITEEQLRSTLESSAASGRGLGEGLMEQGLVERDDLEDVLCEEIQEVALGLFRNGSGRFSFSPGEQVESDTLILLPVESLIEEDSQAFRQRVPALAMPAEGAEARRISIAPEEWAVIASIDGRRTVAEIAARTRMSEFSLLRSLQRLRSLGLVVLPGDQLVGEAGPPPPSSDGGPSARRPPPPPPPPEIDLTQKAPVWTRAERGAPTVDLTEVREREGRDLGQGAS